MKSLPSLCFLVCVVTVSMSARAAIIDDGWRHVVPPDDFVRLAAKPALASGVGQVIKVRTAGSGEGRHSALIRYKLRQIPLRNTVHAEIWLHATGIGPGSNPCLTVYGVDNNWQPGSVSLANAPAKLTRIADVTAPLNVNAPLRFPVTDYLRNHFKDDEVSFLIEADTPDGFSQTVDFKGPAWLGLAKMEGWPFKTEDLLKPIWKGTTMIHESALPVAAGGEPPSAGLAFVPSKILSVSDRSIRKFYQEGRDFVVKDGRLILQPGSGIPFLTPQQLRPADASAGSGALRAHDGGWVKHDESSFFPDHQMLVTYEHAGAWAGPVPECAGELLKGSIIRLKSGKPFKIAVFGDSISVGGNASGQIGFAPFLPRWSDLLRDALVKKFGTQIEVINPSLGGMNSEWGAQNIGGLVARNAPDLTLIAFGMNDAAHGIPPEKFRENLRTMMTSVRERNPGAEFLLLMSFQPNGSWRKLEPMPAYLEILKSMEAPGVAVADLWSMHGWLLQNKSYWDMTGNGVNHTNDFLTRLYAQVVLARLGVE